MIIFTISQMSDDRSEELDETQWCMAFKTLHEAKIAIEEEIHEYWVDGFEDEDTEAPPFTEWEVPIWCNQQIGHNEWMGIDYVITETTIK